ncbi:MULTISPECIES: amino acid ABC transporter permease [Bacillaceae]|uniref:amino acid ABC transporter permease n=1 Tax=Neobacillus sp. OS1-2 TaxID=3070680 RepID=UPI001A9A0001|nr:MULTISPECIES: amino acid ABC transporter permease [Bacillaceae]
MERVFIIIQIFFDTYEVFIFAALLTLRLTITSLLIGCLIGLIMAFFKISTNKWLNKLATGYIGLIRGTPLIVQIAILYFGIASVVTFSQFWAGALALAIHNGAYIAEIFRGSIQSIDRGQMEAARSLGMSYPLAMRRIILPQAFKFSIPPLGNQFIIGLKDSSLVAYVGMSELWGSGLSEAASNYRQLDTYIVVGLYYLILVMLFTYLLRKLEMRMDIDSKPIT